MVHPKIVLGTMTFGTGDGGRIQDHTEITKILDDFNSRGYDELDTARSYCGGNTEQVLNQLDCSKLFKISTKAFPFHPGSHKPDQLENQLNESLAALGQSKIDIFYLHAPDHSTPFEKTCSKIDQLYKKGKFTRFGLSNFPSWAVMEIYQICKHNGYVLPTVYQGRYSCISRDVEKELFPCLWKLGIQFYAYNPLQGGLLAGKLKLDEEPDEGRFRPDSSQGQKYRARFWNEAYFNAVTIYKDICCKFGLMPVNVAFRWLIHHSFLRFGDIRRPDDAIIIGASSYQQYIENFDAFGGGPLPDELVVLIEKCWQTVAAVAPSYGR